MFVLVRALTIFALTLLGRSVLAQAPTETAEGLFRSGREAIQRGDYATACENLRESNRLEPAPGTWLNLGLCEEKLGHWVRASEHYRRVIETVGPNDKRATLARAELDALEPKLPRIVLRLEADAPGTTVVSHGEKTYPQSSFGVSLPMDVGEQVFIARAEGFTPREYRISLREGERRELFVRPNALAARAEQPASDVKLPRRDSPAAARHSTASASSSKTLGWVLVGTGAGAFVVSGVAGGFVLHNKSVVEAECTDKACASQRAVDAGHAGKTWSTVSMVAFGAGTVLAGVGVYFLLSSGDDRSHTQVGAEAREGSARLVASHAF